MTHQPHKVYRHSISLPNGDLSDIQESCSSNSGEDSRRPSGLCADVTDDIEKEAFEDIELVNQSTSAQSVKSYRRNAVIQEPLTINKGITSTGEAYLFHGTKLRNIISIIENGFIIDPKSEGLFGTGLYLAESSQKADQYADEVDDRRTTFLPMFVVRTSLGKVAVYDKERLNQSRTSVEQNGDSEDDTIVAGENKRFREFIKKDSTQCYPEFLIFYDRI